MKRKLKKTKNNSNTINKLHITKHKELSITHFLKSSFIFFKSTDIRIKYFLAFLLVAFTTNYSIEIVNNFKKDKIQNIIENKNFLELKNENELLYELYFSNDSNASVESDLSSYKNIITEFNNNKALKYVSDDNLYSDYVAFYYSFKNFLKNDFKNSKIFLKYIPKNSSFFSFSQKLHNYIDIKENIEKNKEKDK